MEKTMNNFEIKDDDFNQSMSKYVEMTGHAYSMLVSSWDHYDDDGEGNIIRAELDEDKMYESLNREFSKWMKENADATIEFPAQRWTDDSDEPQDYTATMKLTDFDWSAQFSDKGYYGGLQLELTAYAPEDNEDFDNEINIEPVVLLAAWKIQTLLNADSEFWNNITEIAWEDSVDYITEEEETA
jgi:hypothetical protein